MSMKDKVVETEMVRMPRSNRAKRRLRDAGRMVVDGVVGSEGVCFPRRVMLRSEGASAAEAVGKAGAAVLYQIGYWKREI